MCKSPSLSDMYICYITDTGDSSVMSAAEIVLSDMLVMLDKMELLLFLMALTYVCRILFSKDLIS